MMIAIIIQTKKTNKPNNQKTKTTKQPKNQNNQNKYKRNSVENIIILNFFSISIIIFMANPIQNMDDLYDDLYDDIQNDLSNMKDDIEQNENKIKLKVIIILLDQNNVDEIIKKKILLDKEKCINLEVINLLLNKFLHHKINDYKIKYLLNYNLNLNIDDDELESTNDELESTNDELESTNEYNLEILNANILETQLGTRYKNTDSLIIFLSKKAKIYYIKKQKEKHNKTRKR